MDPEKSKQYLIKQFAEFGPCGSTENVASSDHCSEKKVKRKGKQKKSLKTCEEKSTNVANMKSKETSAGNPTVGSKGKKRPPPTVIVFEEPGKKKKSESADDKGNMRKGNKRERDREDDSEDETDFISIAEEVKEFGMTGFSRKDRKKYEQQRAQSLGAKAPKGLKMPYKIVMYASKVRKQREIEDREQKREMGIFVKKKEETKSDTSLLVGGQINPKVSILQWENSKVECIMLQNQNSRRRENKYLYDSIVCNQEIARIVLVSLKLPG